MYCSFEAIDPNSFQSGVLYTLFSGE